MIDHPSEEQLFLYYYGERTWFKGHVEEHLHDCEQCRASYRALQRVLNSVDSFPVPERGPEYEDRVWAAVQPRVAKRPRFHWRPALAIAAMVVVVVSAFFAGQIWRQPAPQWTADNGVRERVLLVAVGDHLERSQMVLVELANAGAPKAGRLDISYERQAAEDLLESNRLYRQTAATSGDAATAAVLEDLERVLLEIAHSPAELSAGQLRALRKQIEDRGILLKVKVYGSQVGNSTSL